MSATAAAMYDRGSGNGATKDIWKNVALFLSGVVLALGGVWATHVRDAVSREEVSKMINEQGPYVKDKSMLEYRLTNIESAIGSQNTQLNRISDAVGAKRR